MIELTDTDEDDINVSWCCALDVSGNLWTWGYNRHGQLGDGTTTDRHTPVQIMTGTKFNTVFLDEERIHALDVSGNLWAWGDNRDGQLGDGTTTDRITPVQIMPGTKFKNIFSDGECVNDLDASENLCICG